MDRIEISLRDYNALCRDSMKWRKWKSRNKKWRWHDLRKNPKDLPAPCEVVLLSVNGSDMLNVRDGERIEGADIRDMRKKHGSTLGFLKEGVWYSWEHFPLIVHPKAWKRTDEFNG